MRWTPAYSDCTGTPLSRDRLAVFHMPSGLQDRAISTRTSGGQPVRALQGRLPFEQHQVVVPHVASGRPMLLMLILRYRDLTSVGAPGNVLRVPKYLMFVTRVDTFQSVYLAVH